MTQRISSLEWRRPNPGRAYGTTDSRRSTSPTWGMHCNNRIYILALASLLTVTPALARDAAAGANSGEQDLRIEEIIVTATKREINLQDVPISVNVVSAETLRLSQENELSRLSKFVPSLRFIDSGNDVSRSVSIRGVGTNTFSRGVEQSVGTSIDGVVSDSLASSLLDFSDVQRIEVLHGPQGMLFGKNASAGLINIITNNPSFELGAGLSGSWADGDEIKTSGFVTGPITDQVAGRLSFYRNKLDAYIKNVGGRDHNNRDEWGLRGKLEWQPRDELNLRLTYAHAERSPRNGGSPVAIVVPGGIADLSGVPRGKENDKIDNSAENSNDTELDTYILDATWTFDTYSVSSITSYTDSSADADVRLILPHQTDGLLDPNHAQSEVQQFTQEIRVASALGGFIDWIAGLYYYDKQDEASLERNTDLFYVGAAPAPDFLGTSLLNKTDYENTSAAVFGTLTFNISDNARINTGLRLNYDEVSTKQVVDYNPEAFLITSPESLPGTQDSKLDDTDLSWRISSELDIDEDVMVYASVGQGYKGPGANTLPTGTRAVQPIIDPEIPTSYEIGIKSLWWDSRIRANAAIFYTEFKDFQTTQVRLNETSQTLEFFLANAGKLETRGIELDAAAQLTSQLSLTAVVAYIDAEYADYEGAQCYQGQTVAEGCIEVSPGVQSQDLSGTELWNSPDWSFTLGGHYRFDINERLAGYALGSYNWQDDILASAVGNPRATVDSYGTMDIAIGVDSADGRYGIQLFVKNLFDEFYETSAGPVDFYGIERAHTLAYTYKRRIGVALEWNL